LVFQPKNFYQKIKFACRRITWRQRALPAFLIIGAQRAGTTSLFRALRQHPQLYPSFTKEVHYFDSGATPGIDNYARSEAWYRSHFPLRAAMGSDSKAFEASPLYLYHPDVPARLHALLPQARLIVLLRDPVERAISQYLFSQRRGYEPLPLMEALQAEEQRLQDTPAFSFHHHSYKTRGHYAEQLQRYLALFPREQLLIRPSERWFSDPQGVLQEVCAFVGVPPFAASPELRNDAPQRPTPTIDPAVYAYLHDYFTPHKQALFALLGEEFDW
jgi:ethanolamine utilization protein EutP (predicted NTPase)